MYLSYNLAFSLEIACRNIQNNITGRSLLCMRGQIADKSGSIDQAAMLMGSAIIEDKLIHVIGPGGHSNIGAYEMFWRAGGLVPINAILDPGTALLHGAVRSNVIERLPGYAKAVMDAYRIEDGVIIIVNGYGINAMTIDVALEQRRRGLKSIAVTSSAFSKKVPNDHPARHPSGKNLCDLADVFVDTHMPYGDAVVDFPSLSQKVAPSSTLTNCFAVNLLVVETVNYLVSHNFAPPLWQSANVQGGEQANKVFQDEYGYRIKHLL
ncbi:sugar isomerase domain-containing protein [Treponema sp.]